MARNIFLTALFIVLSIPALACAHVEKQTLVDVRIVSDSGRSFKSTGPIPVFTKKESSSTWRQ